MPRTNVVRAEIAAALNDPNFIAVAARLTGGLLRQIVSKRLADEDVEVVVISAMGTGRMPPYRAAEIVWQLPDGGDFQREVVRWDLAPRSFPSDLSLDDFLRIVADCKVCSERNELLVSGAIADQDLSCSQCGAPLGTVSGLQRNGEGAATGVSRSL